MGPIFSCYLNILVIGTQCELTLFKRTDFFFFLVTARGTATKKEKPQRAQKAFSKKANSSQDKCDLMVSHIKSHYCRFFTHVLLALQQKPERREIQQKMVVHVS